MGQALTITRTDHCAADLRAAASKSDDAAQVRRLLAIALALDGDPRSEAAERSGMDRSKRPMSYRCGNPVIVDAGRSSGRRDHSTGSAAFASEGEQGWALRDLLVEDHHTMPFRSLRSPGLQQEGQVAAVPHQLCPPPYA